MKKDKYSSLENALRLLNMFTVEKPEYQVNELAEQLAIAPSTAHRLLTTLSEEGFIVKDTLSNKYRLGIAIRAIESIIMKDRDLFHLTQAIIDKIVQKTNLSTSLTVNFRNTTFYLYAVEVENPFFSKLYYTGQQHPLFSTSAGHVFLVSSKVTDIRTFVTDPSTVDNFRSQLQRNGYIQTQCDHLSGISTIAVPIKNKNGEIVAALEMMGNDRKIQTNIDLLKKAGVELSKKTKDYSRGFWQY